MRILVSISVQYARIRYTNPLYFFAFEATFHCAGEPGRAARAMWMLCYEGMGMGRVATISVAMQNWAVGSDNCCSFSMKDS